MVRKRGKLPTFLQQEQRVRIVSFLHHIVPGRHNQWGQPLSNLARRCGIERFEDVAVRKYGPSKLQRHVCAQCRRKLRPEHVIARVCTTKAEYQFDA